MPLSFLPKRKRWFIRRPFLAVVFFFVLFIPTFFLTTELLYAKKIYPGVSIGVHPLGGKTKGEAIQLFNELTESLIRNGFPFVAEEKRVAITPILSAPSDPDLTYDLINWDVEETVNRAYAISHDGPFLTRWLQELRALLSGTVLPAVATIQQEELLRILRENFLTLEEPAHNATFAEENGALVLTKEKSGSTFTYEQAIATLENHVQNLTSTPIQLVRIPEEPSIRATDATQALDDAQRLLRAGSVRLTIQERWWRFQPERIKNWLTVKKNAQGVVVLGVDKEQLAHDLDIVAGDVNIEPRDAKFRIENGRVVEFMTSRNGRRLDNAESITRFEDILQTLITATEEAQRDIELTIIERQPKISNDDVNTLGITELLGVGRSNFKGSPQNRRHNIRVGAAALNGILISPGKEFSLLDALGDIDAKAGYKPELVIKGNRTIPEFGGGLCQIGTTTFRAALASGLPITERQNHSYNVPYYLENGKPGTDATIYHPKPDFRFVNDTGNTILIQTKIEGDTLLFEFWGKGDGRTAERTEPKVWNIRKAGPTKIIETADLPPGKKKCTERAHDGATAEFTYTVTLPSGEKREQIFKSVYRPWQAVCLVGVAPEQKNDAEASSEELLTPDTAGARGEQP